ncbi:MAG: glycosyltransferase family 4 protein [Bacteroidetes bacterium]|nr:glycosyltransferase family 4 protein [Bacteroidota bacterium]HET6243367.1 glycosyltransferase family 4 protein [Bacteroidia bacterium]
MDKKKRILVFIDWFLPGYKAGGPVQSCNNLIEQLKDEYDFSIITRDTDYCEQTPYPKIKSNEWIINHQGTRVYYISSDKLYRKTIRQLIKSEDFDLVYLNGIYSLYFTLIPLFYLKRVFSLRLAFKTSEKKIIVAARGMLSQGAVSIKRNKKMLFIKSSRIIGLFSNVIFHATNTEEARDITLHFGANSKIFIAPNLPKKFTSNTHTLRIKENSLVKIVNIARIAPEKGLLTALLALENVNARVDLDIYGPLYDENYWQQCKLQIKKLPKNISVNYKGSIPGNEIDGVLRKCHFMLMATMGENYGHVIIESLSAGCPVIISNKTPWKNLTENLAGWEISLNELETFSKVIEKCAQMDQLDYNKWSKGAYLYAEKFINNAEILEQNRELFRF